MSRIGVAFARLSKREKIMVAGLAVLVIGGLLFVVNTILQGRIDKLEADIASEQDSLRQIYAGTETYLAASSRFETVRAVHSQVGIYLNSLDISEAVVTKAKDTATARRSSLIDIDAAQSYSDLMRAQSALNAAIQIAGQLPPPGLVSRGG